MPAIIGTGAHTCLLSLALEHIHACYVIVLDLMSCDSENLLQFIGSWNIKLCYNSNYTKL